MNALLGKIIPLGLLLLLLLSSAGLNASTKESRQVLILYSEDKAHPAHELTDQGIRTAFRSNKLFDVKVFSEYLDLSRFKGHDSATADYLRRKYAAVKIDAIISIYPPAFNFLMREEGKLLPGVPIVAVEILRAQAEKLERSPSRRRITGLVVGDNIAGIMDSVFRMRPGTKRVALVAGVSQADIAGEEIFRKGLKPYVGRIDLIDLTGLPMRETLSRVGSLPPDTIILYSTIFTDGAGRSFVPREALALISRAANVPVIGLYDSYLGYGIVGGPLVRFERRGSEAATFALRIMGGESPVSIPFGGEKGYANLYDWQELRRWGISEKALLPDSIVKFKPPSIWEAYWQVVLGGALFIFIETFLIIGLLVNLRRRKQADQVIRKSQSDYQELAGRLLTVQETERRRLARELHDDLSQRLAALAIETGFIERDLPSVPEAAAARIREIGQGLVNLSGSVHDISRRLHPSILEDLGLPDAIRSQCDGLARCEPIEVQFESRDCPPRIPLSTSLCLYRVTQESLRNIVKHARATRVSISLTGDKETIHLLIKDNGRGFDPMKVPDEIGLGLISMRERARLIQGEIFIRSQPGQGATIEIKAPLKEGADDLGAESEEPL
jgi:signal transduction histidine kinase